MNDQHLSPFFSLKEFTRSSTATRLRIDNTPTEEHFKNLAGLCRHVLTPLRIAVGTPIRISSGYRSPALNKAVKGSSNSQHCAGEAADFTIPGYSIRETVDLMTTLRLPFDQLIDEFGEWVHVSHGPRQRRQVLKARHNSAGKVVYSSFYS